MTIKGIDMQIMVQRGMDYAKDSAAALKKNELAQDFQAVQSKIIALEQQEQVMRTEDRGGIKQLDKDGENEGNKNPAHQAAGQGGAAAAADDIFADYEEEPGTVTATRVDIRV